MGLIKDYRRLVRFVLRFTVFKAAYKEEKLGILLETLMLHNTVYDSLTGALKEFQAGKVAAG